MNQEYRNLQSFSIFVYKKQLPTSNQTTIESHQAFFMEENCNQTEKMPDFSEQFSQGQLKSFLPSEDSQRQLFQEQSLLQKQMISLLRVEWETLDILHCPFIFTKKKIFNPVSVWKILDAVFFPKGLQLERQFVKDMKDFRSLALPKKFDFLGSVLHFHTEQSSLPLADKQYLLKFRNKLI